MVDTALMTDKINVLKNVAGIAVTTGLAFATQGSSTLVLGVLNSIAGDMAAGFLERTEYHKLQKLIKQTDPSELNHDVRKLVVEAVEWTIMNLEILYKKKLKDSKEIKELESFTESLLANVKVLNDALASSDSTLYKTIEKPDNSETVLKTFDLKVEEFPVINKENPYNDFFKYQFKPNLQLCFGELLKQDDNRPALIAYQRQIYQDLGNGIDKVLSQNDRILKSLERKEPILAENKELKKLKSRVKKTGLDKLSSDFDKSLNALILDVSSKADKLITKSDEIMRELERVKDITKGINRDLKTGWMEKNKVKIHIAGGIFVMFILMFIYHLNTTPFNTNVSIAVDKGIEVHPQYPWISPEARLRFFLPNETKDKQITSDNEILLADVPSELSGRIVKIQLLDRFWTLKSDSLTLKSGNIEISVIPNDFFSRVQGSVMSRDGQHLIQGAVIIVEGLSTTTNSLGQFILPVPIPMRKPKYILRVEKEGFSTKEMEYIAGSDVAIRLLKLQP